jgi:hypothetical protein
MYVARRRVRTPPFLDSQYFFVMYEQVTSLQNIDAFKHRATEDGLASRYAGSPRLNSSARPGRAAAIAAISWDRQAASPAIAANMTSLL